MIFWPKKWENWSELKNFVKIVLIAWFCIRVHIVIFRWDEFRNVEFRLFSGVSNKKLFVTPRKWGSCKWKTHISDHVILVTNTLHIIWNLFYTKNYVFTIHILSAIGVFSNATPKTNLTIPRRRSPPGHLTIIFFPRIDFVWKDLSYQN